MLSVKRGIFVLLIIALPMALLGQGYVQSVGAAGSVDWTNQMIRATGIGAANPNLPLAAQRSGAIRAAKLDAYRNLLEIVKGVNLTSETTVENAMLLSDVIQTRVDGVLRGARMVGEPKYMSTGDVEVEVEAPLTGIIADAVLPQAFGGGTLMTGGVKLCPTCGQPWPAGKPVPGGVTLIQSAEPPSAAGTSTGVVTGLIVDASGLGLRPAMAPKVLDESMNEIYGSKFVSREYAVDIGMVGYDKNVEKAAKNERVADTPLVVKAVKATGPNKTDVVVSAADATKIHNAAANMNFLQHCKVMFILD
ncbi:LPP20 family lipoprotein [bacterium]|nr:LPP20 family lipoprotein [bacterium]